MVLDTLIVLGAGLVMLFIVATIIRLAGGGRFATLVGQVIVNGAAGYALLIMSLVSFSTAAAILLLPIVVRAFAYVWFRWQNKKLLNGDYGKQAQWGAELIKEGDQKFIEASAQLGQMELREVGIMSDSKEELCENTIERAEESNNAN